MINLDSYGKTSSEITFQIAQRLHDIRRRRKISQQKLSELSGVSLGSVKRFERTGEISLKSLALLAGALHLEQHLEALFQDVPPESIEEIIRENRTRSIRS